MNILIINSVCGIGSTGKICVDIADRYSRCGNNVVIAFGRDGYVPDNCKKYAKRIGSDIDVRIHVIRTRLLDDHGYGSKKATRSFLKWAEKFNPDILWLHNIHGYYINIELLFEWIKTRKEMQIKWTLHDCWSFTGHCSHFSAVSCNKWIEQCMNCPQKKRYPSSLFIDNSFNNYIKKRELFTGIKNLTIIVPSHWLERLVKMSFLKEYNVDVSYNTIDSTVYKPRKSDFRTRYKLDNKRIVLGVASSWDDRKGLYDFYALSRRLSEAYTVVLVGLTARQLKNLPKGIIGIEKTHNQIELAEIYTAADIFVNPSLEETFGLTTIEAESCGTYAIVYKGTACEEIVLKYGGLAIDPGIDNLVTAIENYMNEESPK